jgi:hypothetical protein
MWDLVDYISSWSYLIEILELKPILARPRVHSALPALRWQLVRS